jgi:sensor domain DACNV-containing protein
MIQEGVLRAESAYPLAPAAATAVAAFFGRGARLGSERDAESQALIPDSPSVVAMVDAAFWTSLRREEGRSPRLSMAFVPRALAGQPLTFERPLPLSPDALASLAPAVERPGIHLGVWGEGDELRVWGATRTLPEHCFVVEVVEPGLIVLKYRRGAELGKFGNMAVLRSDQIRVVNEHSPYEADCTSHLAALFVALLDLEAAPEIRDTGAALLKLAVSMRAHGRGGALLVVPSDTTAWRESIIQPMSYAISPPFARLADLLRLPAEERGRVGGRDGVSKLVDAVAGLTAVDGVAVINDRYEVLAFGSKIGRRDGYGAVEQVLVVEPLEGDVPALRAPVQIGGTRHLSAAQFIHDQRDALALVASQDGRFTAFAWSTCQAMVMAHRIETLLF